MCLSCTGTALLAGLRHLAAKRTPKRLSSAPTTYACLYVFVTLPTLLQVREKDWCNVITAHQGDSAAYTWRLQNFTLGEHVLKPPKSKKRKADSQPDADELAQAAVTAVGMSQCGNYGLVGRASGSVDRYNMQSGLHRGSYTRCAAAL